MFQTVRFQNMSQQYACELDRQSAIADPQNAFQTVLRNKSDEMLFCAPFVSILRLFTSDCPFRMEK